MDESQRLALAAYASSRAITEQNKIENRQRDEEVRRQNLETQVRQLEFEALSKSVDAPHQFKLRQAEQAIDGKVMSSMTDVKRDIRNAKVPRGRIVRFFLCDVCGETIKKPVSSKDPHEGFIVQGNIFLADPDENVGLVGNNIPEDRDSLVNINHIKKTVLCKTCLLKALGIDKSPLKRDVFIEKPSKKEDTPF